MIKIIKKTVSFFLSLGTSLWLMGVLLIALFSGALIMPGREEFQGLHSTPLFQWMIAQPLSLTWWLWAVLVLLSLLTINTLFCSVESLVKKKTVTQWLLLISPQIIHLGFLFMLLAHLLSSMGSTQQYAVAFEGARFELKDSNIVLKVSDIEIKSDAYGYTRGWEVAVEYLSGDRVVQKDLMRPNEPSLFRGLNINVKDLQSYPEAVLLQMNKEPGAFWALVGGILFTVGIVTLIVLKIRMEK